MRNKLLIGILALIVIAGGAYAIFHKSPKSSTNPAMSSSSSTANQPASSGDIVQTKTAANVGQYLADSSGNALYTYGGDTAGKSNCSGSCLYSWPIYDASNAPSTLPTNVTVITRSDGSKQYAYKGLPLYIFSGDSAGHVTGDGVSDFHIAKP
jgi:predicted lipoprotein with Yx(FWY)xxD motif